MRSSYSNGKSKLIIPDSNIIIYLFELGLWAVFIQSFTIIIGQTALNEVKYYNDPSTGRRISIDLSE